ncbi:MAG: hypothetical protein MR656_01320 [Bacteroidales bacterium]|nr:hypothetical protein [Bacteroidales bacterium]MCI6656917.1 hypothetical protein [Bacteroidales bacterium]MDD7095953.1 hypothetical protein [Bacteroidales bacterium]
MGCFASGDDIVCFASLETSFHAANHTNLRHPLSRANHIPPRTKTTRLTAKNPACLLYKNRK